MAISVDIASTPKALRGDHKRRGWYRPVLLISPSYGQPHLRCGADASDKDAPFAPGAAGFG